MLVNFLFAGSMGHQCQHVTCITAEKESIKAGTELDINGKRYTVKSLELVDKKSMPKGFGETYRVELND